MADIDIFGLKAIAEQEIEVDDPARLNYFQHVFNLKWNPFPEVGVPESEVDEIANIRPDVLVLVGQWLADALRHKRRKILMVKGQYGSGKSLLLRKLVSYVTEIYSSVGKSRPKIIYVYRPSVEAQALNRAILEGLGLDNIRKMVWNVVSQELVKDLEAHPRPLALANLFSTLLHGAKNKAPVPQLFDEQVLSTTLSKLFARDQIDDHRRFLQEFDRLKRNRLELKGYFTDLLSRGLADVSSVSSAFAFVELLLAYDDSEAWQSLLNVRVPRRDRAGFVRQFLQDLITLLRSDNYSYLFVAIDEFEQITDNRLLSAKEQADYAYTVMEIINQIDDGLGLIISITEEGFQKLAEVAPLKDRLLSQIELGPLSTEEAAKLISFYLDQARAAELPERQELFPLQPALVDHIVERIRPIGLGATPRNLVQFFHNFLEYCYRERVNLIEQAVVDQYLRHYSQGKLSGAR